MNTRARTPAMTVVSPRRSASRSWTRAASIITAVLRPSSPLMAAYNSKCSTSNSSNNRRKVLAACIQAMPNPNTITQRAPSPPRRRTAPTPRTHLKMALTAQWWFRAGRARYRPTRRPRRWATCPVLLPIRCTIVRWQACPRRRPCSTATVRAPAHPTRRVPCSNK